MLIGPLGLMAGAEADRERHPELAVLRRAKSRPMSLAAGYCRIALRVLGNNRGYPDETSWECFQVLPQAPTSQF